MGRPSLLSQPFSSQLTARLVAVLGAAALAPAAACGTNAAGPGGATTTTTTSSGSTTGSGGHGGATTTSDTGLGSFDAGIPESGLGPPPPGEQCFEWEAGADACPTDPSVVVFILDEHGCTDAGTDAGGPLMEANGVETGPSINDAGACCYVVDYQWCVGGGRPYLVDEQPRIASATRGAWGRDARATDLDLAGLEPAQRAALAAAWTEDALLEHASVASFSRFSLSLLAAGAPADLLALAHRAALDEVRHAELCFALASRYAGAPVAPGRFPTGDRIEVSADLADLAASAVREGCVGETVAAVLAAEQHARAQDPAVRAALSEIAADEARHAELAWRTVAWAIEAGGAPVREAVARAFAAVSRHGDDAQGEAVTMGETPRPPLRAPPSLEAHGRVDAPTRAAVVAAAIAGVVLPAARALGVA